MIQQGVEGHYSPSNNAFTLRHGGKSKEYACLGLQTHLLWSRIRETTPLHREQSSARGNDFAGPVQGHLECGDVI